MGDTEREAMTQRGVRVCLGQQMSEIAAAVATGEMPSGLSARHLREVLRQDLFQGSGSVRPSVPNLQDLSESALQACNTLERRLAAGA